MSMYKLFNIASFLNIEPSKANLYMLMIETSVNKAIIQHRRITNEYSLLKNIKRPGSRHRRIMTTIFSDIHHYLICWAEISRLYNTLRAIQPIFIIPENQMKDLKEHRNYRNHLEHIDERIERGISDLGNLSDGKYTFDGKELDISNRELQRLKQFYRELIKIACDNFDQPFQKFFEHCYKP